MELLWVLIIVPLILPFIFRIIWPHKVSWVELGISVVVGVALTAAVYGAGMYGQTADTEILNGEVRSKSRTHGSYVRTYDCRCHEVCSGSGSNKSCTRKCDTCYEDRYTVDWTCNTTLGAYTIKKLDTTSRSVYATPDPARYTSIKAGDPVAQEHGFTNYVKAAPDSLFHATNVDKFKSLIPLYPDTVFDYYRINRVFAMGVSVPDLALWNHELSLALRTLGPQKQANAIIVMVNTNDQSYVHALEGAWVGGKKNDIIVVIGTTAYPKIDWVAVSSWTDKQLFKVQLRDEIMSMGNIDRTLIISALSKHTMSTFVRKSMKDFEYLRDQIEPPLWVLIVALLLGIIASLGTSFYFYRANPLHR